MISVPAHGPAPQTVLGPPSIEGTLQHLFDSAQRLPLTPADRIVIFSDFHLGDGGPYDDFRNNAALVQEVLRSHYLASGHSLVLNGDIEELQRFRLHAIRARWKDLFDLFDEFRRAGGLYKIIGNHDETLPRHGDQHFSPPLLNALRFTFGDDTLFVFHGHQATIFFERFNMVSEFFLRYFANALRIRNVPVTYESRKKYRTEHRVYSFSSSRKIVSIIGHTHRPLFESLSKIDTIRFRIEQLCRDYPTVSPPTRAAIETAIVGYRKDLDRLWEEDRKDGLRSSLYNAQICIPCLFNSGSAIGKSGVTAIEIADGTISLVHWFDRNRGAHHLREDADPPQRLGRTEYYRTVLKKDKLEYIFGRIRLLA